MAKYCPKCESEYQNNIKVCPDDNTTLTSQTPKEDLSLQACDIYAAASEIEAERIITFLQSKKINACEALNQISQIPTRGQVHHLICVPKNSCDKTRELIKEARTNNVISSKGMFISFNLSFPKS